MHWSFPANSEQKFKVISSLDTHIDCDLPAWLTWKVVDILKDNFLLKFYNLIYVTDISTCVRASYNYLICCILGTLSG